MTDTELINEFIQGEYDIAEWLEESVDTINKPRMKKLLMNDMADTKERIKQLKNIIKKLKAFEIIKKKVKLITYSFDEEMSLAINNPSSWKYPLTKKEFELLNEVLEKND